MDVKVSMELAWENPRKDKDKEEYVSFLLEDFDFQDEELCIEQIKKVFVKDDAPEEEQLPSVKYYPRFKVYAITFARSILDEAYTKDEHGPFACGEIHFYHAVKIGSDLLKTEKVKIDKIIEQY